MYAVCAAYVVYFNVGRLAGWFPTEFSFLQAATVNPTPYLLIARGLSAATGVMTAWTVDRLGTRLFDRTTGLVGAFFVAVAMLPARDSHFGVTDVAATWLICMSVLFTVNYMQTGSRRHAIFSAVCAGLAASTKYNTAFVVLPAVWAIGMGGHPKAQRWGARGSLLAMYCGVAAAAFVAGTPYAVLDCSRFHDALLEVFTHLREGHHIKAGSAWIIHVTSSLRYGVGWPLLAAGIGGFALAVWNDWRKGSLFALFPVVYFAVVGAGQSAFARYIIPVVPFMCLAAAHFAVITARSIARWSGRPALTPVFTSALAVALAAPSAWSTVNVDRLLSRTDNRLIAEEWIRNQFANGATLYQSGAIYGHVQMQTADPRAATRYHEVQFDEGDGVFREADGNEAALPDLILVQEAPLAYCDVPDAIRRIVTDRYLLQRIFAALDASDAGLVYDRDDAFFVPLAGFDAVLRPGPNLTLYRRR